MYFLRENVDFGSGAFESAKFSHDVKICNFRYMYMFKSKLPTTSKYKMV